MVVIQEQGGGTPEDALGGGSSARGDLTGLSVWFSRVISSAQNEKSQADPTPVHQSIDAIIEALEAMRESLTDKHADRLEAIIRETNGRRIAAMIAACIEEQRDKEVPPAAG